MVTKSKRTVLHIVDRTGGGVPIAAATYIRNSPDDFHHVVLAPVTQLAQEAFWRDAGAEVRNLCSGGHLERIGEVRTVCAEVAPDVIHAHSSYAGAYARLAVRRRRWRSIVYTPHCFAFERTDIGILARALFYLVEGALAWNTDVVAACSARERGLATRLNRAVRSVVVPNVSSVTGLPTRREPDGQLRLGMIGRISPQKAPADFAREIARAKATRDEVAAIWIGDGEAGSKAELTAAGVDVTGWIQDKGELQNLISGLDVYLHTAAWEGFPIALLDALRLEVPALVSAIKPFSDLPRELTIEGGLPQMLAASTNPALFEAWRRTVLALWASHLQDNTSRVQTRRLREVWADSGRLENNE